MSARLGEPDLSTNKTDESEKEPCAIPCECNWYKSPRGSRAILRTSIGSSRGLVAKYSFKVGPAGTAWMLNRDSIRNPGGVSERYTWDDAINREGVDQQVELYQLHRPPN